MVYLAIIHGAQGMTWYTYAYRDDKHGAPWSPERWAYLKQIAGELSQLSDVLTSPDPPQEARGEVVAGPKLGDLGYPSLNLRLKQYNGARYLLAANSAEEPIQVRISAPGLQDAAKVMFEDRQAPVRGTCLVDDFAALAVHVYRW